MALAKSVHSPLPLIIMLFPAVAFNLNLTFGDVTCNIVIITVGDDVLGVP